MYKELLGSRDDWNPTSGLGNPCTSPAVDVYLTFTTNEQKQVGVTTKQAAPLLEAKDVYLTFTTKEQKHVGVTTKQAAPLLEDNLGELLPHTRVRALAAGTAAKRITITRDIALFALAHHTMRRGFDLSFTRGSQVLRLPESGGFVFNFLFGKTLRSPTEAVVVRASSSTSQDTGAVRAVAEYIDAAQALGWDLSAGYLFSPVLDDGSRGPAKLTAPHMASALQAHLRAVDLPTQFTMHSFRVEGALSRFMGGAAIEEVMQDGGWKTESLAKYYVAPSFARERAVNCTATNESSLSPASEADFAACARRRAR